MRAIYKVPNGKLLKIFLEKDVNNMISFLNITGDFFTYPEENIEKLETHLIGTPVEEAPLTAKINDFLSKNPTDFFGLDVESLVKTILSAQ